MHKADMKALYEMIEKKGRDDMVSIQGIQKRLYDEIELQENINKAERAYMQTEKTTKEEAPLPSANASDKGYSAKVQKLISIFNSEPQFTDLSTLNAWKRLGPFNLALAIEQKQILVDERYNITEQKHADIGAYHHGQVNHFEDNNEEGVGRMEWVRGDMYEGESDNGDKQGYGRYIWKNGDWYQGDFNKGVLDGFGTIGFADGTEYKGMFRNGRMIKRMT